MATNPAAVPLPPPATLLQRSFDTVIRHAAVMVWCVVIVSTPLVVLGGVAALLLAKGGHDAYVLGNTLMALTGSVGGLIAVVACMYVALRDRAGEPVSLGAALRYGARWYPRFLLLALVVGVGVFFGFVALIVPGVYLAIRWVPALPAMLVEGGSVSDALGRSWALVERRWWATLGRVAIGYLLPSIVAAITITAITSLLGLAFAANTSQGLITLGVSQVVGACISTPFTAVFLLYVYTDLAATQPVVDGVGAWPPPVPHSAQPAAPITPPTDAIPSPPPASGAPLPGGFLPPVPQPPVSPGGLASPPERPPAAGD